MKNIYLTNILPFFIYKFSSEVLKNSFQFVCFVIIRIVCICLQMNVCVSPRCVLCKKKGTFLVFWKLHVFLLYINRRHCTIVVYATTANILAAFCVCMQKCAHCTVNLNRRINKFNRTQVYHWMYLLFCKAVAIVIRWFRHTFMYILRVPKIRTERIVILCSS